MAQWFLITGKLASYFLRREQAALHHKNMEGMICDSEDNELCFRAHVHSASTFSDTGEDRIYVFTDIQMSVNT